MHEAAWQTNQDYQAPLEEVEGVFHIPLWVLCFAVFITVFTVMISTGKCLYTFRYFFFPKGGEAELKEYKCKVG